VKRTYQSKNTSLNYRDVFYLKIYRVQNKRKTKVMPISLSYLDKIGYPNKNPGAFTDHAAYFTTKIDHTYTLQGSKEKQNHDQSHLFNNLRRNL